MTKFTNKMNSMLLAGAALVGSAGFAAAQDLGTRAESWREQGVAVSELLPVVGVVLGFAALIGAAWKLKKHNEDPRENPMKAVLFFAAAGVCLLFLGAFASFGGGTIFGDNGNDGGDAGVGEFTLGALEAPVAPTETTFA